MSQTATQQQQAAAEKEAEEKSAKAAAEKDEKSAKDRIDELLRRNKELEKLVNMDNRLKGVETGVAQIGQHLTKPVEKPPSEWDNFMRPKVAPIIEEALLPYKQALLGLGDQNDLLRTMINYPEYNDPEIQQEVESARSERQRQTGQYEPRENVILYMRGKDPEKFAKKGGKKEEKSADEIASEAGNRGQRGTVHTESSGGVGTTRAAGRIQKTAEDATVEEMEKFMAESGMKF